MHEDLGYKCLKLGGSVGGDAVFWPGYVVDKAHEQVKTERHGSVSSSTHTRSQEMGPIRSVWRI